MFLGEGHHGGGTRRCPVDEGAAPAPFPSLVLATLHRLQVGRITAGRIAVPPAGHMVQLVTLPMPTHKQVPHNTVERPLSFACTFWNEPDILALAAHHRAAGDPTSFQRRDVRGQPGQIVLLDLGSPPQVLDFVDSTEKKHLIAVLHPSAAVVLKLFAALPLAPEMLVLLVPLVIVRLAPFPLLHSVLAVTYFALPKDLVPAQKCPPKGTIAIHFYLR